MTEQTQNSWNGDFPSSTIASVIENCFFVVFLILTVTRLIPVVPRIPRVGEGEGGGDSAVPPRTEQVLSNPEVLCSLLGDSPGSSLSGWQLYQKKKKKTQLIQEHM